MFKGESTRDTWDSSNAYDASFLSNYASDLDGTTIVGIRSSRNTLSGPQNKIIMIAVHRIRIKNFWWGVHRLVECIHRLAGALVVLFMDGLDMY